MSYCDNCGRYKFASMTHLCEPEWLVWRIEDDVADAHTVHASTAESAVKEWAEWDDRTSADYTIARGGEVEVLTRRVGVQEEPVHLVVSGESCPHYYVCQPRKPTDLSAKPVKP